MKKLLALLLATVMCFSLAACGNQKHEEFKADYAAMYEELQMLNTECDKLTDIIYSVWSIVGTDNAPGALAYMLQIDSNFDDYWDNEDDDMGEYYECLLAKEYGWLYNSTFGISLDADAKEFHALCMGLQESYNIVETTNSALPDKMKELYSEYKEKYTEEYDLLNELYLEVSSYAEFSLSPSGSLMSYPTAKSELQNTISKLVKAANIY